MFRFFLVVVLLLSSTILHAQQRAIKSAKSISEMTADELFSRSVAFVGGVYDYSNGWSDLPGVKSDITEVADILKARGFKVETNVNLSKKRFIKNLDNFLYKYGRDRKSRILVYYAGHGHSLTENGKKTGYIVLKDAGTPSKGIAGFKNGSIPMTFFSDKAKQVRANQVLFIFDSCFSGTVFSAMRSIPELIADLLKKPVRQFISSGTENQLVPDDSVFKRRFVDGLEGDADIDGDTVITGSELGEFLRETVSTYSAGTQTPVHGKMTGYEGEFIFFNKKTETVKRPAQKIDDSESQDEKSRLIEFITKNPHHPDAQKAMARLREIDESVNKLPPLEQNRKDFKMSSKSVVITKKKYLSPDYPYVLIAPVLFETNGKKYRAAFKIKAKDKASFKKLNDRKNMLKSVIGRRLNFSSQQPQNISLLRDGIKATAYGASNWVCPDCVTEQPIIAGLMGL